MIDLHVHTNESDGSLSPSELIAEALRLRLHTLAITDHDTLAGYDEAVRIAPLELKVICGIEISTRWEGKTAHLLGYFQDAKRLQHFRDWIRELQNSRHERNLKLLEKLNALGVRIATDDIRSSGLVGRPHFARLLVEGGYASSLQQAFDKFLGESGTAYVERSEPTIQEGIRRIKEAGGVSSLAHPTRLMCNLPSSLPYLQRVGLDAIEVYHSDIEAKDFGDFLALAARFELLTTGGSDFHGANKPGIELGTGRSGNVRVPDYVLTALANRWSDLAEK